jgi:hypothetical protein
MKFLYFQTANDDATCFNADKLNFIDQNGDGTILCVFSPGGVTDGDVKSATVTLNVTSGKEDVVMAAIAKAARTSRKAFVTIADDANKQYIHGDITSCGAIALTA